MRLLRLLLAGGLLAAAGAWLVSPAEAANRLVRIQDAGPTAGRFEAAPGSSGATINQGDVVFWENHDDTTHNATGQGWGTGNIAPGGEASVPFNTPGRFDYSCTIHPSMTGTLQVNAVSTTAAPGTAAPMQPPPTTARPPATARPATATTRRTTATTAAAVTTTIPSDFAVLAPTTTEQSTTSTTSGQLAIREDDDDGGSNSGAIAALAVGVAVVLGGGAYALARLRGSP